MQLVGSNKVFKLRHYNHLNYELLWITSDFILLICLLYTNIQFFKTSLNFYIYYFLVQVINKYHIMAIKIVFM